MQILTNTDNQGIKSLSKERRKTLETYQQLFYLLQVRTITLTMSFGSILYCLAVVYSISFPRVKLQQVTHFEYPLSTKCYSGCFTYIISFNSYYNPQKIVNIIIPILYMRKPGCSQQMVKQRYWNPGSLTLEPLLSGLHYITVTCRDSINLLVI